MFKLIQKMDNNDTFQHLLYLTGLNRNDELLIKLFEENGCTATPSQIRRWRRKTGKSNSRPVPHRILETLFKILLTRKNQNPEFCLYKEELTNNI